MPGAVAHGAAAATPAVAAATQAWPAAQRGEVAVWGSVTVAGMPMAVPLVALREVVPAGRLQPLASRAPAVAGALALRGVSVPVIDLQRALGRAEHSAATSAPPALPVLVLLHQGRLLGLRVDSVAGLFTEAAGSRVQARQAADNTSFFDGSLRRADDGALHDVLSVAALAALPGVPWIDDPEPARAAAGQVAQGAAAGSGTRTSIAAEAPTAAAMLLTTGALAFAIDPVAVHATLWEPRLAPAPAGLQGVCSGTVISEGRRLPAVRLDSLLGLGVDDGTPARHGLVIERPEGRVVLLVGTVLDIVPVPAAAASTLPAHLLGGNGVIAGVLEGRHLATPAGDQPFGGLQFLRLDGERLRALPRLAELAAVNVPDSGQAGRPTGQAGAAGDQDPTAAEPPGRELITVQLPQELAMPVAQVREILPFGSAPAIYGEHCALRRIDVLHGRALPVMCLARLLGLRPGEASGASAILVVESETQWLGFAVPTLRTIVRSRREYELPAAHGQGGRQTVATVGDGAGDGAERTLPLVDLTALAQRLLAQGELATL